MLNILDLGFLCLSFAVTCTGFLINNYEKHVPAFLIKGFKYGSFAYQGSGANYLQVIEIPKAYYRHFYAFASVFSTVTLFTASLVYFWGFSVHSCIVLFLKFILEQEESAVSVTASCTALTLVTIQSIRRCYETYCLQVFAKSSKMNLSHYVAGLMHYFAVIVATIGQAPMFCGSQDITKVLWIDTWTKIISIPSIVIFLWAGYEQFQSNIIFAKLRKDKMDKVITESHRIPYGRLFHHVSSPHRLCEIILYTVLVFLVPTRTYFCIYLWVLCNQIQTAIQAHVWYNNTFKEYPKTRSAIFPGIL